jgi:Ca-activated chloride channel family protein
MLLGKGVTDMDAVLKLDHSLVALQAENAVFGLLELAAPEPPADAGRPKLGIALVVDRSGSMSGQTLEVAKACAGYLAERITPEDRLGVVSFDDEVSLVAAMQGPGDELGHAISRIHAGGSTNLSGGWLKGVELLESDHADIRRVVLLTDGQANVGIVDHGQLSSLSGSAADRRITTTTIGFGEGFDEELLPAMADAGRGNDYFAATPEEAPSIFAQEFEGLATLVAQNLSVEIRPVDGVTNLGILNEYPIVPMGSGLQAALGDVYGGMTRKLVFRIHSPSIASLGEATLAEIQIRWTEVGTSAVKMHTRTIPIKVNVVPGTEAAAESADEDVTEQVVILEAARARKEARKLADSGDFEGARQLLVEQAEHLKSIPLASRLFATARDDLEEFERFASRLQEHVYDRTDSKMLWEQSRRRHRSEEYRKRPDRKP